MNWKKKRLENYRLCVILNRPFFKDARSLAMAARKIVSSGGGFIQFRDKESSKKQILGTALLLKKQLGRARSIFIINDHADIAVLAGADGVHLGQDDLPLPAARKLLGEDKIIGVSCLDLKQALLAQEQGADYLGVGAVFATATKPESEPLGIELLRSVTKRIKIPVFAIGGIKESNVRELLSLGANGVAVSSAICCAQDPALATHSFVDIINS